MSTLVQDFRYSLRVLARKPGFTAVVVLTLALGIGANTAMFSVVNKVLLDPLPFPQPERLVSLHASKPNFERGSISYPNFIDWQKDNRSFTAMGVFRPVAMTFTGMGEAERVAAEFVTADFFSLLGVKPVLGRTFTEGEDRIGAAPIVLASEGFWQRKLGSSREILGRTLTLDGRSFTIVGVIPASFHMGTVSDGLLGREVYVPMGQWNSNALSVRGAGLGIHGIARLKPGVTLEQARADMAVVTQNLARAYPDTDRGRRAPRQRRHLRRNFVLRWTENARNRRAYCSRSAKAQRFGAGCGTGFRADLGGNRVRFGRRNRYDPVSLEPALWNASHRPAYIPCRSGAARGSRAAGLLHSRTPRRSG
jgi:hypothetical protein